MLLGCSDPSLYLPHLTFLFNLAASHSPAQSPAQPCLLYAFISFSLFRFSLPDTLPSLSAASWSFPFFLTAFPLIPLPEFLWLQTFPYSLLIQKMYRLFRFPPLTLFTAFSHPLLPLCLSHPTQSLDYTHDLYSKSVFLSFSTFWSKKWDFSCCSTLVGFHAHYFSPLCAIADPTYEITTSSSK